jgi:hypothetical protein
MAGGVRLEQWKGDEMIAPQRHEMHAGLEDGGGLGLDGGADFERSRIFEGAIAVVHDREVRERINAERVLRIAVEDRRGAPDRLRPEARPGPVRGGGIERNAPDHRVDAVKVAAVAAAHERQHAAIGRLLGAAAQRPENGIVGGRKAGGFGFHAWNLMVAEARSAA